jgi:hypothetical protein
MLKHIPKSDINLRPFKVYKTFTATENTYDALLAYNHTGSNDVLTNDEIFQNGIYHQLYTMYYRDPHNVFTSYGDINAISESYNELTSQRHLDTAARVISIPQKYFGEGIKPGSIALLSNSTSETLYDDSYGNLISNRNKFNLISIDVENGTILFYDKNGNEETLSFTNINVNDGVIVLTGQTHDFINFTATLNDNYLSFDGNIEGYSNIVRDYIGNVFYSHGLIVITNDIMSGSSTGSRYDIFDNYDLIYKSTNTIYENEILLVVDEDEFNISTNPTSYTETNSISGTIDTTYEGNIKYRHSDKYQKAIFADYEYSSSIDSIGSYLAPYITTIGLYDENMDMVAVAKLATPIKSTPDLPVNFLVRFDS